MHNFSKLLLGVALALCTQLMSIQVGWSQEQVDLFTISVMDTKEQSPLPGAIITLTREDGTRYRNISDAEGTVYFHRIPSGSYRIRVTYIGYEPFVRTQLRLPMTPSELTVKLTPTEQQLSELFVVTARESRGMTSASHIDENAMKHIQASSFGDVLELLPGGVAVDSYVMTPRAIRLREAFMPAEAPTNMMPRVNQYNYATGSLGTAFLVDGVPLANNASMLSLSGLGADNHNASASIFNTQGVDMRTVGTDDIESIEVIRGIPSVEHANLSTALISIKRKRDLQELEGRFKADMRSKLIYVAKGTNSLADNHNLTVGVSFLSSNGDPRLRQTTYQRLTGSIRSTKLWRTEPGNIRWLANIDYTGSLDGEKADPDESYSLLDSYHVNYQRFSTDHSLSFIPKKKGLLAGLTLNFAANYVSDMMSIVRSVFYRGRPLPHVYSEKEGEFTWGFYPQEDYVGRHKVDDRPLYLYAKLKGNSLFWIGQVQNNALWGVEWNYSKNLGKGTIFDPERPVFQDPVERPYAFSSVPAMKRLTFFAEDKASVNLGGHRFTLQAGATTSSLLGLEPSYRMSGRFYTDIRANAKYDVAPIYIKDKPLGIHFAGGYGTMSVFPVMQQLYPNKLYHDIIQYNTGGYPNRGSWAVNAITYIFQPNSKGLRPAINKKWEVRMDADYANYFLTVTYFRENMPNGFRTAGELTAVSFKRYDVRNIDWRNLTTPPDPATLKYKEYKDFSFIPYTSNGSQTKKEGIEWVLNTPRYEAIQTRATFSGAWFKTIYKNSYPLYYYPRVKLGRRLVFPYYGLYKEEEGLTQEMLNTDLRLDTYLREIGLNISASVQTNWYASSEFLPKSEKPESYIGLDLVEHPYTAESEKDTYLQHLIRGVDKPLFEKFTVPISTNVNVKAAKYFFDEKLRVALFVNRLFDYSPDFYHEGFLYRRNKYPYFGMELNVKL